MEEILQDVEGNARGMFVLGFHILCGPEVRSRQDSLSMGKEDEKKRGLLPFFVF